ncbi:MAG: hypothetical protein ABIW47_03900 [Ginsengibacter sp.]|jgi:hypothetical protein
MLEIIALIFITREVGKIAASKGLKPLTWKIYAVLAWIIFEIWGFMIALMFFEVDNYFSIMMVGLMFAVTGYIWIKARLNKIPDNRLDDDINNLGE